MVLVALCCLLAGSLASATGVETSSGGAVPILKRIDDLTSAYGKGAAKITGHSNGAWEGGGEDHEKIRKLRRQFREMMTTFKLLAREKNWDTNDDKNHQIWLVPEEGLKHTVALSFPWIGDSGSNSEIKAATTPGTAKTQLTFGDVGDITKTRTATTKSKKNDGNDSVEGKNGGAKTTTTGHVGLGRSFPGGTGGTTYTTSSPWKGGSNNEFPKFYGGTTTGNILTEHGGQGGSGYKPAGSTTTAVTKATPSGGEHGIFTPGHIVKGHGPSGFFPTNDKVTSKHGIIHPGNLGNIESRQHQIGMFPTTNNGILGGYRSFPTGHTANGLHHYGIPITNTVTNGIPKIGGDGQAPTGSNHFGIILHSCEGGCYNCELVPVH